MTDSFTIMCTGLNPSAENCASTHLSQSGHQVILSKNFAEAREKMEAQRVDMVYIQASESDRALDTIKEIGRLYPSLPVIVVCEQAPESFILETWRAGAADILISPVTTQSLEASFQRGLNRLLSYKSEQNAQPSARLFYLDENGQECRVTITPPRLSIGRLSDNDLVIGQMGVSRRHAEVIVQDDECLLHDVGSKMGTYLNGEKIKRAKLKNGDRIQLGGNQGPSLTYHTGDLLQTLISSSSEKIDTGLSFYEYKEIGHLFATFRALSSTPVLDELLVMVVDTAIELTGAERGFIMLKEKNEELTIRCARNNNKKPLDEASFQTSRRVPQEVFKTGRPVVIKDLDLGEESETHDHTRQLGLRSISCVPLRYLTVRDSAHTSTVVRTETIGVLYVDSSSFGSRMSNTRIDALETLASEASIAIYNAWLYKISQDKRKIDEQLALAREIQQALLPESTKELEYVRACSQNLPCYDIGGDYFDYFDLENGNFGFSLGDVAGKGMPAAILASLIQGMFAAQNFCDVSLPSIMVNVNRNLVPRGTGNRFVTFFLGIVDPEGNCNYINAGHNPPFLLSRDGSMKELTAGGMVLGIMADAQYEMGTTRMQPDDHLVLFSDGVTEALNTEGEEFGVGRLVDLLRANAQSTAPEILSRLHEAVLSFSANTPQYDDITMMVLGYRESRR
jgi:sigma-B regulation protein RsbU (phosphoserine phosphatase)